MAEGKRQIIDRDTEAGTFRTTYNYPSEPPSIAIPMAVQELTRSDVTDLDPMHSATDVDPDALDELFRPDAREPDQDVRLRFTYHGYAVTVKEYGRIVLQSPTARRQDSAH